MRIENGLPDCPEELFPLPLECLAAFTDLTPHRFYLLGQFRRPVRFTVLAHRVEI